MIEMGGVAKLVHQHVARQMRGQEHERRVQPYDAVDAPTFLAAYDAELKVAESTWKRIKFHALREHAGLVFQTRLEA